ncbi:hypothetical protein CAPTEDRAFT_226481 [Capitella teleta]|uniref:Uncharacterized protein n=1 Tax=Capitella teleta TaxID=283909 RepID=R7TLA2_CAPTE|nr:hypothetical protein CAPTEDRAFT_226481 [Capitella teleta]|eukprot:ELT92301.1 hypothetical protein CAPTEDRAFT_226481 [Capitella teleta]
MAYLLPIVLCCVSQVVMFAFNALSTTQIGGLFLNNTGDISDIWYSNITPSGATFSIWGIIYAWQVLFIGYALSTICRKGVDDNLYISPGVLPPALFYVYAFNNCLNIAWLFLWDRTVLSTDYLIAALVVISLTPFSLYICVGITCYTVEKYHVILEQNSLMREIWLIRFLVQNAFAIYATWTTIATILNLGAVMTYVGGVDMETTSLTQLGILSAEILAWFLLDLFALDRYTRYLFTPHFVLVWAFTGSFMENYAKGEGEPHATFIATLLGLSAFALFTKIVVMTYRGIKHPLYKNSVILPTLEHGSNANPGCDPEHSK